MVLLQRYLDNLLHHATLSQDPVLLLFAQTTDFTGSIKDLHIVDPLKHISARVTALPDAPRSPDAVRPMPSDGVPDRVIGSSSRSGWSI